MSELQEALDRAGAAVRTIDPADRTQTQRLVNAATRLSLLAIVDTLVEIAAALPAPHTIPKEPA